MQISEVPKGNHGKDKVMNRSTKFLKIISIAALIGLALFGMQEATSFKTQGDELTHKISSTDLVGGESLRTTLINRGVHQITARTTYIDADGADVKHGTLVLEPGQMKTFEISRSEVVRGERMVMLLTEVSLRRVDAKHVWMASEVIDLSTGSTRFQLIGGDCDEFGCGTNHNETRVRNSALMK